MTLKPFSPNLKRIIFYVIIFLNDVQSDESTKDWTNFVNEVEEAIASYSSYIFPTNNDQYFPAETKDQEDITDFGTFDFIIVGGGTAGGVLANRLTEESFKVLVLEAGKEGPSWTSVLGLSTYTYQSEYMWGYNTTQQTKACLGSKDRRCFYPRGKVLGGSSVVNGGLYVRGNSKDYDRWEELGNPGWSYKNCLPYFKKSENAQFTRDFEPDFHGTKGPQKIDIAEDTPELTSALLDAFSSIGKPEIDYNGKSQDGAGRVQFYLDFNKRASTAHAFIDPVKYRGNLRISLESFVTKIRISQNKAQAVEFIKNGKKYLATAFKEIIVSAGSINSPQILMLSGIGPKTELEQHGIKVVADLPVGKLLRDHLSFPNIYYRTNHVFYNSTLTESLDLWREAKRPLVAGIMAQIVSFFNFEGAEDSQPEIEIYVNAGSAQLMEYFHMNEDLQEAYKSINRYTDILMNVVLLHPRSKGSVQLQSSNPRDFPLIDANYLSDPDDKDIENIYKGIQALLKLNETKVFQDFHAELFIPSIPRCEEFAKMSKDWWYCAIRTVSHTLFHPVGTTKMGPNPKISVVNTDLRIHGIQHLRVVDAGVMPSHVSGHTNAAVVMLAEKIADVIKADQLFCQKRCLSNFLLHLNRENGIIACERRKKLIGC